MQSQQSTNQVDINQQTDSEPAGLPEHKLSSPARVALVSLAAIAVVAVGSFMIPANISAPVPTASNPVEMEQHTAEQDINRFEAHAEAIMARPEVAEIIAQSPAPEYRNMLRLMLMAHQQTALESDSPVSLSITSPDLEQKLHFRFEKNSVDIQVKPASPAETPGHIYRTSGDYEVA